jgi:phosphoglycerate dehydrogenase-like enzyme
MVDKKPQLVFCHNGKAWVSSFFSAANRVRLDANYDWKMVETNVTSTWTDSPNEDAAAESKLAIEAATADALIVCHGSPFINERILDKCKAIRFVGELEGDRFASRIDVSECEKRGIPVIDTTNGSSYPVAEWALALSIMGLRNYGSVARQMIVDRSEVTYEQWQQDFGYVHGELTGKTVGILGFGHIGRKLMGFLKPFSVKTLVYDPYVTRDMADVFDIEFTNLSSVFAKSDVVISLLPITPLTKGMLASPQFSLMRQGSVFVNVSRGLVVNHNDLLHRLRQKDIIACLDVFDPEPIPANSPFRDMSNVILSPHIAGVTAEDGPRFLSLMIDELNRFFSGVETRYNLTSKIVALRFGRST